jgi:hypothetical protein
MIGNKVGFLTVIRETDERLRRNILWECVCDCGTFVLVSTTLLRREEKKSCGCKTKAETSGTHGMYGTPTYRTWMSMIQRCTKPYHKSYEVYKNFKIDPKWMVFTGFFEDMGVRPEGHTLDRINGELGYNKENCRWATLSQQQQNKRPNKLNRNKGLAGVAERNGRFCAKIRYDGQREHIGTFDTPEEANEAYNARGREIFGKEWVDK